MLLCRSCWEVLGQRPARPVSLKTKRRCVQRLAWSLGLGRGTESACCQGESSFKQPAYFWEFALYLHSAEPCAELFVVVIFVKAKNKQASREKDQCQARELCRQISQGVLGPWMVMMMMMMKMIVMKVMMMMKMMMNSNNNRRGNEKRGEGKGGEEEQEERGRVQYGI